ncbi:MAG TPA: hypothetical protein GX708_13550, partial [Gallicola sp.]|nr:hypothetical protein [Gallicola sp.]
MNDKALKILEYNTIINKLVNYTKSKLGKKISSKLEPISDFEEIEEKL